MKGKTEIYDDADFFNKYLDLRKEKYNYNDMIEQPIVFGLLGDVKGKRVLDIGCGYGCMSVRIADEGAAYVLGTDVSERMIEKARSENARENIDYDIVSAEKISETGKTFDVVVSCLAIHYVEDLNKLFKDVYDILTDGGEFVFSMEHPIYTANMTGQNWIYDDDGRIAAFVIDHYGSEGVRNVEWLGKSIVKYHHKTDTVLNALIEAGFKFEKTIEPSPGKDMMEKVPRTIQEFHRPAYLIVKCRK